MQWWICVQDVCFMYEHMWQPNSQSELSGSSCRWMHMSW